MKQKNKILKIFLAALCLITLTGCTKQLKGADNKIVKDEKTGKVLVENIICRPTDESMIKLYTENNIDIEKLPECDDFKAFSSYDGLWTTVFVRPLAWVIINLGVLFEKIKLSPGIASGLAIIISCLLIRLILFPFTKKTAMQSEKMKGIQSEVDKLEKKYKDKTSEEDQKRKAEEMMVLYKKNNVNPLSSCLLTFIQIPLLFAYLEAIQRTPVIFENKFLGLDMGTTISHGIRSNMWYVYVIFLILVLGSSFLSFRKTLKDQTSSTAKQMKGTIYFMLAMIVIASFSLPVSLGLYWIASSLFTVIQNKMVEKKKEKK